MKLIEGDKVVYLDGKAVNHCIAADVDKELVRVYETDDQGNIIMENRSGKVKQLSGKVEIRDKKTSDTTRIDSKNKFAATQESK
jgi:hypothetical protein